MSAPVSGTEGYADEAEELFRRYEMHGQRPVLNLRVQSSQEANRLAGVTWTNLAFAKVRN